TWRQVVQSWSMTLHERFAIFVTKDCTFTTTAFSQQYTCTCNTRRVELPEFHILQWNTCTRRHAKTVTSIDIGIGRCTVNTTRTTGSKQCGFTLEYSNFTSFLVNCSDTKYVACFVTNQIKCDPFYEELCTHFHVALIKRVKKCVTCTVGSSTCTWHRFFTVVRRVATEWTLVNCTISVTVKWHTQVF